MEEKVGQLFCPICFSAQPDALNNEVLKYHAGGITFKTAGAEEVREAFAHVQRNSRIPLLCSANLEFGSTGLLEEGTHFAQQMGIGTTNEVEQAYRMGKVSCAEAAAVDCNFAFAPVSDLDLNWRNPIVNVRSYGSDPQMVLDMCSAYKRAADGENVAVCVKHFPGDGVDERDQHLLTSINSLSCDEWDKTYGFVYRGLIDLGARAFMIGHIDQPAWRKKLNPDTPAHTVPATLSPELLKCLLRTPLGYNGLIITDATPMVGFTSAMKRSEAVPYAIAAGCDMFLFNKSLQEDYEYMLAGVRNGILTQERLSHPRPGP